MSDARRQTGPAFTVGAADTINEYALAAFRALQNHRIRCLHTKVKTCASLIKFSSGFSVEGVCPLRHFWIAIVILTLILSAQAVSEAKCSGSFQLSPTSQHHVAGLNSNMPYVAGFHVVADDLSVLENVNATAVTVSFPESEPKSFPFGCWLGGGMFVQGQDHVFRNVDYGFYMMLVLDASGRLFVDLGLHQTEEATLPIQMAMSSLVYAYTWQITAVNVSTPVTLLQGWDSNGCVDYSISVSGNTEKLITVNVTGMPNCQNMIRTFFAGNVVIDPFPFSRYVNYFQFGVISNHAITDTDWHVGLKEPQMLTTTGWTQVNKAWSLQGDHSYLDHDLMWGGTTYKGVDAQYYQHPLQNPYEMIFYYDGHTLTPGRVLWNLSSTNSTIAQFGPESQALTKLARQFLPVIIITMGSALVLPFILVTLRRRKNQDLRHASNTNHQLK